MKEYLFYFCYSYFYLADIRVLAVFHKFIKCLICISFVFPLQVNGWYLGESWSYDNKANGGKQWTSETVLVFEKSDFPLTVYVWSDLYKTNKNWDKYAKMAVDIINKEYKNYRNIHGYLTPDMPDSDLLHYCFSWECVKKRKKVGKVSVYIEKGIHHNKAFPRGWNKCSINRKANSYKNRAGTRSYEIDTILWGLINVRFQYVKIEVYEKYGKLSEWEEYELNTLMHELLHAIGVLHLSKNQLMNQHFNDCFEYSKGKHGISELSICYPSIQVFEEFRSVYTDIPSYYWQNSEYQKRMKQESLKRQEEQMLQEMKCTHSQGCVRF